MKIVFVLFAFLMTRRPAQAYPEFIGLGYTGCMTCHYNGAGNGGLNDYGRGLFAAEVASKILWNTKKTDDALSASSGFLGSKKLPYWFRPSYKYRGLIVEKNPGSKNQKVSRFYQMQQDLNFHVAFDEEQTFLLALNLGALTKELDASPNKPFSGSLLVSREYYVRGQVSETLWFYLGFLDKVFGIRHPDHTAINRTYLGLGQNHQVHSFILHYAKEDRELFVNPFIGNLHLKKEEQFPGLTLHYEFDPAERWRLGVSYKRDRDLLSSEINTLGFLLKRGLTGGHSLLAETGVKSATSLTNKKTNSFYVWTQSTMRLTRGVFLQSFMQYFKADISKLDAENMQLGLGFMAFPMQRVELRWSALSKRTIDTVRVTKDSWAMQSQLHLSF